MKGRRTPHGRDGGDVLSVDDRRFLNPTRLVRFLVSLQQTEPQQVTTSSLQPLPACPVALACQSSGAPKSPSKCSTQMLIHSALSHSSHLPHRRSELDEIRIHDAPDFFVLDFPVEVDPVVSIIFQRPRRTRTRP